MKPSTVCTLVKIGHQTHTKEFLLLYVFLFLNTRAFLELNAPTQGALGCTAQAPGLGELFVPSEMIENEG